MYQHTLRVPVENIRRLGVVVNIGLAGRAYPLRRRWFTTHFFKPQADPACPEKVVPVLLSSWNEVEDKFEHAEQEVFDELANWIGLTPAECASSLQTRVDCLADLTQGQGASMQEMYEAIEEARKKDARPDPSV